MNLRDVVRTSSAEKEETKKRGRSCRKNRCDDTLPHGRDSEEAGAAACASLRGAEHRTFTENVQLRLQFVLPAGPWRRRAPRHEHAGTAMLAMAASAIARYTFR